MESVTEIQEKLPGPTTFPNQIAKLKHLPLRFPITTSATSQYFPYLLIILCFYPMLIPFSSLLFLAFSFAL